MKTRNLLAFVLLFFGVILARPTYAQDATLEVSTEATANVTVEANPVMIIITPTPDTALATPTAIPTDTGDVNITVNQTGGETPTGNETPTAPIDPLSYIFVVLAGILVIAGGIYSRGIISLVATLVPPETATSIYQSGVRIGFQMALERAAQTPTLADDEFFTELAKTRGLLVIKSQNPDGTFSYTVSALPTPTTPSAAPNANIPRDMNRSS